MGSWIDYGLGSENENLPAFVVLNSVPSNGMPDQGFLARLWGAGFLPSKYQGVQFRGGGEPPAMPCSPARLGTESVSPRSVDDSLFDWVGPVGKSVN